MGSNPTQSIPYYEGIMALFEFFFGICRTNPAEQCQCRFLPFVDILDDKILKLAAFFRQHHLLSGTQKSMPNDHLN
jgi:hypothetical protein